MDNTQYCSSCNENIGTIQIESGEQIKILCESCYNNSGIDGLISNLEHVLGPNQFLNKRNIHNSRKNNINDLSPKRRERLNNTKKKTSNIEKFCENLSKKAINEGFDPIVGRDDEINQIINTLNRRRKNNPILLGEPGVGKTAIIEYISYIISKPDIPEKLKGKTIYSLDLSSLIAGTKYRGDFEQRLKQIFDEIKTNKNIILFIDEIHMIMGAGSSSETKMDLGNILKPYLSRGDIQIIGATTLSEYRIIEQDAALNRRFQTVLIEEPSLDETVTILNAIKSQYEKFHNVHYSDSSISTCVKLADRYISDKFMPDKAIDILDEVGSRASIIGNPNLASIKNEIDNLYEKQITASEDFDFKSSTEYRALRLEKEIELEKEKLKPILIETQLVERVVEELTNIPVTKLDENQKQFFINLERKLLNNVIGQKEAVSTLIKAVKRNRFSLRKKRNKPIVLLFAGPTGVGKTELTKSLAEGIFGNKNSITRFDMSEYMEENSINKLIGAPPGYVGHGEPGQLTEKVKRKPYSVILLDEIEKAHPKLLNIFLQMFDEGRLTDSKGITVDFSKTIIIMTSNLGVDSPKKINFGSNKKALENEVLFDAIRGKFSPELRNRIDEIVLFNHLNKSDMIKIIDNMLSEINSGLSEIDVELEITESAKEWLSMKGYDRELGARPLQRTIVKYVEDEIINLLLNKSTKKIVVNVDRNDLLVLEA